jgi:hypothetical protein
VKENTTARSIAGSTRRPAADGLVAALGRARLTFERRGDGLYLLRAPSGRRIYVAERAHGASGRSAWLVFDDGFGAEAPRQIPCATIARTLIAIRSALAADRVAPAPV